MSIAYKYDDTGFRTQKTVNGTATDYLVLENRILQQSDGTNTITFRYDGENKAASFDLNGTEYYYLRNLQGDIAGIVDGTGSLVVEYTYDAWGKLLSITGSLADTVGVLNPLRYRGYYYDTETGLYYLQSRYYDPETGRFLNADETVLTGVSQQTAAVTTARRLIHAPVLQACFGLRRVISPKCLLSSLADKAGGESFFMALQGGFFVSYHQMGARIFGGSAGGSRLKGIRLL